ncbi:MAG: right-handed parallel beta-helix repeat-containing protein [Thermodesulfobacteriota bacterium]
MKWAAGIVVFLLLSPCRVLAADLYVDRDGRGGPCSDAGGGGSAQTPWCTIARANMGAGPGDTVNIRAGTYDEVIAPRLSGKAGRAIVFKAYPGERVIVRGRPGTGPVVAIGHHDNARGPQSHIVIDGLRIERGFPEAMGNERHVLVAVNGTGSSRNIIRSCTLAGTDLPLSQAWAAGAGVRVGGIAVNGADHTLIENNAIENMTYMGILVGESPAARFTTIRGNRIRNMVQDGIHSGSEGPNDTLLSLLIEGNEIFGSRISDGIQANGCYGRHDIADCTGIAGVVVRNNHIHDNAENNIDLKGTRSWVIEGNVLHDAAGNNDGGLKPRPQDNCDTPPCDNTAGGGNVARGGDAYSRDIILRDNVVYGGNAGIVIGDGYMIYNNTILNNRRTYRGPDQPSCILDGCSRKPDFPGLYGGGREAVIVNNIVGDNGFAVCRWGDPEWFIDNNLYYWSRAIPFRGLAQANGAGDWQAFSLEGWRSFLRARPQVGGRDEHSTVAAESQRLFRRVEAPPAGVSERFDFNLADGSPAVDAGGFLTEAVGDGEGNILRVGDARFFFDGYGVTDGDKVQIGAQPPVRVARVDYAANTLILEKPLSWQNGDPVSLPFKGAAPDAGAGESPRGPMLLRVAGDDGIGAGQ